MRLEDLFPFSVACEEVTLEEGREDQVSSLYAEEERLIGRSASPKRWREFRAGRHAARQALRKLGVDEQAIGADDTGVPRFPEAVNGSITHTGRGAIYAACVATSEPVSVGIDAEAFREISAAVSERVLGTPELQLFERAGLKAVSSLAAFSAKEAAYKCVYPTHRVRLDFSDLLMTRVLSRAERLSFALEIPKLRVVLEGAWRIDSVRLVSIAYMTPQGAKHDT